MLFHASRCYIKKIQSTDIQDIRRNRTQGEARSRVLWEQEAAGSNPATPTPNDESFFLKLYIYDVSHLHHSICHYWEVLYRFDGKPGRSNSQA